MESNQHLDDISSWADAIRPSQPETAPWHFVDIPLDAAVYDAARDCGNDACVVAKIVSFEQVLADKTAQPADRLAALKWVVHVVGDVHQPLHCEDHADRGGNEVHLSYFHKSTNLHAIWDGAILEHALDLHLGPNYSFDHDAVRAAALMLDSATQGSDCMAWAPSGITKQLNDAVISWANDSHKLAQTVANPDLPTARKGDWSDAYE